VYSVLVSIRSAIAKISYPLGEETAGGAIEAIEAIEVDFLPLSLSPHL
jgi:hypothetical protein